MRDTAHEDQQFVDSHLDRGLAEFETNYLLAIQLIQRLGKEFPNEFVISAMRYLDSNEESGGHRFLTTMVLRQPAIFNQLADPALRTKERATRLLRRFLTVDPAFDVELARRLPDRTGVNHATAFDSVRVSRALDLLDETSGGRRLLAVLGHLPNNPDPRISSRAVLFIGARVKSPAWAEKQLQRPDARARANAIEGIWGLDSPEARNLLEACTEDRCNRVVGNALVGLQFVGRAGVAEEIRRLSQQPKELFRSTAAWTMGKLGDSTFLDPLQLLLRDECQPVRSAALRSINKINRVEAGAAETIEREP